MLTQPFEPGHGARRGRIHPIPGRRSRKSKGASPTAASVLAFAILSAGAIAPSPGEAQSAAEILGQAMERYEANLAGVDDITLRQEVMGIETTSYLVKETVDGHATLRPADVELSGAEIDPVEDAGELWARPHELYLELADRWTLDGEGSIDGRQSWRLILTDAEDLDWGLAPGMDDPFVPSRLELDLAADDLYPLAMAIAGEGSQGQPFNFRIFFTDYREVDGYLHPFVTRIETEGAGPGMSEADMDEARTGLRELEQQLEAMPDAQREMMEEMMGDQIQMLEDMLAGGGLDLEIRVTDLQVNAGPPGSE